jgi:NADH-quinone oxidoreductase subunit D
MEASSLRPEVRSLAEMKIPIGPQHPALKEPVGFMVNVEGERIKSLDLDVSYNHRGIEKGVEQRDFNQSLYLIERICGICSHAHATNFSKGIEELMNLEIPKRAAYIRLIVAELERIHSHYLWVGVAGHEIGFDTLFMYTWRDRELVQDLLEIISGNRVNYAINCLGGVRRDLNEKTIKLALDHLKKLGERAVYYTKLATTEETMVDRLSGVGKLPYEKAKSLGSVGPTARGSGVDSDVRRDDPYLAYAEVPFKVITANNCDVLGRTIVRAGELAQSIEMTKWALENLPPGEIKKAPPRSAPPGEVISRCEAPRGELVHYIKSNNTDKAERFGVRTPTMANWPSVVEGLTGQNIADIPIVVAAIDPCLSCTSRTTFVDTDSRKSWVWNWDELRNYSIRWYRENKGIYWGD